MSFDEFMIIIGDFMSNGNKSLSGHFKQGLVKSTRTHFKFSKKSDLSRCRKNQYSGRNKCHL